MRPIDISSFASVERPLDVGAVPFHAWLKIADLVVDPSYQRDLVGRGRSTVRAIAEGFRWTRFSPVICSPITGGKYAIIDGQHRTTAAALLGFEEVPCQVVVADRREQADAFAAINGTVTAMSPLALFAARCAAGDERALALRNAAAAGGVTILRRARTTVSMGRGETCSIAALDRVFRQHGAEVLTLTCRCITESASGEGGGMVNGPIVTAIAEVLADHKDWRSRPDALIAAMNLFDLEDELQKARVSAARKPGTASSSWLQAAIVEHLERHLARKAA